MLSFHVQAILNNLPLLATHAKDKPMNETLLPVGCYDVLPPYARLGEQLNYQLLNHFESYGYAQVVPPLFEYTESLLAGRGAVLSPQVIRVMEPGSQKVMGLRADMTLQIGRIASTRLADTPRPLRLCYSGFIMRMKGEASSAKREMYQTGLELIGVDNAQADAEVILVALRALQAVGVGHITVDLNLPAFIGTILSESALDHDELDMVFEALAHKDSNRLQGFKEPACDMLCQLMLLSGDATGALTRLAEVELPEAVQAHLERLRQVVEILEASKGQEVTVTLDVTERSGLDYYSGVSFALFATKQQVELGRGGRYVIDRSKERESAIGCTFYAHSLERLLPEPAQPPRVYVARGTAENDITRLHNKGYVTILALSEEDSAAMRNTAQKLGCESLYQSGDLKKI